VHEGTHANEQVSEAAGEVWRPLNDKGPIKPAQMRRRLNGRSDLLGFSAGWLAREDKIRIFVEKKSFWLQLK